jgi:signal recognition particle GTPase
MKMAAKMLNKKALQRELELIDKMTANERSSPELFKNLNYLQSAAKRLGATQNELTALMSKFEMAKTSMLSLAEKQKRGEKMPTTLDELMANFKKK